MGQNPFSWGNYQVGGSFGNESAEYVDGQPVNIGYINLPILIPDQDAISEFKVQYNNLGPEWGRFAGGIVNLSTKGGSNTFHGVAYEYLRNKVLNSRPYFPEGAPEAPPYVQNQFGGTFGGPIIKDKTFFFFAYDGYRQRASADFYHHSAHGSGEGWRISRGHSNLRSVEHQRNVCRKLHGRELRSNTIRQQHHPYGVNEHGRVG